VSEPIPDPNSPRRDHNVHTSRTALTQEHGPSYTAIIEDAAGLRFMLNASAPALNLDNPEQLAKRAELLRGLQGRVSAAAVLLALGGQPAGAAYEMAEMHTMSMAASMEQDTKNNYRQG
jgi:hypothetical protein